MSTFINKPPVNVLWVIDHVCYDGTLHGGGRLYWNVVPRFDANLFRIVPCMLRASNTIREVFATSPIPVRILDKRKFDPTTLRTFLRLIREENIHVMHLHCYGASTFGRLASLITGVPAIIHDYDTEVYFPYPWYLKVADRLLAPTTPSAIAASPMVRDFLVRKRKIGRERIRMMFHAIPSEKYAPVSRERIQEIKGLLGLSRQTKIVGTMTKLGPQRGNEYLLAAAAAAVEVLPELLFVIVYKPTYFHRLPDQGYVPVSHADIQGKAKDLEDLAEALGIRKNVRFIEWPENVNEWISACDLVVAPFLSDRFSSVHLLEAMAMGKPVVATHVGEQREIIEHGIDGYLVPPGDVKEMTERILQLLTKPENLDQMSRCARAKAEQYSADAYMENLQRLYTKLTTNGQRNQTDTQWRLA
jgi:glycosyltransferase involved in cell wall biosynthesis